MAGLANPVDTPQSDSVWLSGILWGSQWDSGATGGAPTEIAVYVAGLHGSEAIELHKTGVTAATPLTEELAAISSAMQAIADVCNVRFVNVAAQADADVMWACVPADQLAANVLGSGDPPGTETSDVLGEAQSLVISNHDAYQPHPPAADVLAKGGYDYITFIHELGHAVGLAHPFDTGGASTVFPGVVISSDVGDFGMNQGVYTMMSYNDGWRTSPMGPAPTREYGYEGTPMALDVAALQDLYGANRSYRIGDDSYALPQENGVGTFYACIWDAGGHDRVVGASDLANTINLVPASLAAAVGGGGTVSYAKGVHGGFTIARGVTIEDATGGDKGDEIVGNRAANSLLGLGGNDAIRGGTGADTLSGGADVDRLWGDGGDDLIVGGTGRDKMHGGAGADVFAYAGVLDSQRHDKDVLADFARGIDTLDVAAIDADEARPRDQAFVLDTDGVLSAGEIMQIAIRGGLLLLFSTDDDPQAEMTIAVKGAHLLGAADFVL